MYKTVPSHALVVAVGPVARNRQDRIQKYFPAHEVLSARRVCYDLVGDEDRPDLNRIVFAELRHRAALKLELGERVVVDAANLRREDRLAMARLASDNGIPVFYLLCDPEGSDLSGLQKFRACEKDVLRGDGVAEVIDWRLHEPDPVLRANRSDHDLMTRFSGITVIGDVHGMYQSLLSALSWARSRNHYVVFLGDVIDYGSGSLEAADEVYRVVTRGAGEMILGNHERKIARWLAGFSTGRHAVRLSDGNRVTTEALGQLGQASRRRWEGRFKGLVAQSHYYRQIGNAVFAHAGVHPGYWTGDAAAKDLENWAMFGEYEATDEDRRPTCTYGWTGWVPASRLVFVGHQIRSMTAPLKVVNDEGGVTVFLDTGAGKGGQLSSADLKFAKDGNLRLENFNMY